MVISTELHNLLDPSSIVVEGVMEGEFASRRWITCFTPVAIMDLFCADDVTDFMIRNYARGGVSYILVLLSTDVSAQLLSIVAIYCNYVNSIGVAFSSNSDTICQRLAQSTVLWARCLFAAG